MFIALSPKKWICYVVEDPQPSLNLRFELERQVD